MKQNFTMKRTQVDGVLAFLRVAERRSFRQAAADLGVSPSALSQTVRALEASLGVSLLARTTRSVGLTEAGALFLERARPAMEGLQDSFDAILAYGGRPSGLLRINASRGVIPFLLEPVLGGFAKAFPEIEVELFADDGLADIVAGGFDAGIRLGEMLEADMIALRLSPPFHFCVVGAPGYLTEHGRPRRPEDLRGHRCIRFRQNTSGGIYRWEFREGGREFEIAVEGPLIVNDTSIMVSAALRGAGLAYVAEPIAAPYIEAGTLKTVLDDFRASTPGLFLYYPGRAQALPKLRAFVDFMRTAAAEGRSLEAEKSRPELPARNRTCA